MSIYDRGGLEKAQLKEMEDVLSRFVGGDYTTDKAGDGNKILSWARQGLLYVKDVPANADKF